MLITEICKSFVPEVYDHYISLSVYQNVSIKSFGAKYNGEHFLLRFVIIHGCDKCFQKGGLGTVDSEMFARLLFSLIFANSLSREFKVIANID